MDPNNLILPVKTGLYQRHFWQQYIVRIGYHEDMSLAKLMAGFFFGIESFVVVINAPPGMWVFLTDYSRMFYVRCY